MRAQAHLERSRRSGREEQWLEAEAAAREAGLIRAALLGADAPATLECRLAVAQTLFRRHRWEEAERELRESLELARPEESATELTASMRTLLAEVLRAECRLSEAEVEARAAIAARPAAAGPHQGAPQDTLALVLGDLGRHSEAAELLAATAAARTAATGPGHPLVLKGRSDRLQHLAYLGRHEEVVEESSAVRAGAAGAAGLPSVLLDLAAINGLAFSLSLQGRFEDSERLLVPALADGRRLGPDRFVLVLHLGLARALTGQGRAQEALAAVETAQALFDRPQSAALAHDHSAIALARAAALLALGQYADAEREAQHCRDLCGRVLAPAHHRSLEAETLLGMALARTGRRDQAAEHLRTTHDAWRAHFGEQHHGTAQARRSLDEVRDHA